MKLEIFSIIEILKYVFFGKLRKVTSNFPWVFIIILKFPSFNGKFMTTLKIPLRKHLTPFLSSLMEDCRWLQFDLNTIFTVHGKFSFFMRNRSKQCKNNWRLYLDIHLSQQQTLKSWYCFNLGAVKFTSLNLLKENK